MIWSDTVIEGMDYLEGTLVQDHDVFHSKRERVGVREEGRENSSLGWKSHWSTILYGRGFSTKTWDISCLLCRDSFETVFWWLIHSGLG